MKSTSLLLLAATAAVDAHTIFQRLYVNGVDQGYLNGIRYPSVNPFSVLNCIALALTQCCEV